MLPQPVLREFTNIGFDGSRRSFPGFATRKQSVTRSLAPRAAMRFTLNAGDMLSLHECVALKRTQRSEQSFSTQVNFAGGMLGMAVPPGTRFPPPK